MDLYLFYEHADVGVFLPSWNRYHPLSWLTCLVVSPEWWGPDGCVWLIPYASSWRFVDLLLKGSGTPTLVVVSAVPFCSHIHYLNGSVVFLHDDGFRVYVVMLIGYLPEMQSKHLIKLIMMIGIINFSSEFTA